MLRLIALLFTLLAAPVQAQGIPVGQLQCQTTYAGQPFQGVIQFHIMQLAGEVGVGNAGARHQILMLVRMGRANEIPGTLMMNGHFRSATAIADFEATMGGNQGAGAVWINGANHRATYADFYLVQGGVIMVTEDNQRVDYICR
jgi:hypothetical protein